MFLDNYIKDHSVDGKLTVTQYVNTDTNEVHNSQDTSKKTDNNSVKYKTQSMDNILCNDFSIEAHHYVLSARKINSDKVIEVLSNFQNKVDLDISYHNSSKKFGNKRILFFGTVATKFDDIKCSVCSKRFYLDEYNKHTEIEHCDVPKEYILRPITMIRNLETLCCEVCGKKFKVISTKRGHVKKCIMINCSYCNLPFKSGSLSEHTTKIHGDPEPFKCFKCKQQFTHYYNYSRHECRSCKCNKCNCNFSNWIHLNRHQKRCNVVIEKKKIVIQKCRLCGERYVYFFICYFLK